jgi:hypothetical protein
MLDYFNVQDASVLTWRHAVNSRHMLAEALHSN